MVTDVLIVTERWTLAEGLSNDMEIVSELVFILGKRKRAVLSNLLSAVTVIFR